MIEQLQRQDFENLAPGSLGVATEEGRIVLEVVELRDLPDHSPRAAPFAVVLQGPASPLLAQAIQPLEHPKLGRLEVFLVPIARTAEHARYELIFN